MTEHPAIADFFRVQFSLKKTLIHPDIYITNHSLHKRIMSMKEKTCEKDEINSVFLRGYA